MRTYRNEEEWIFKTHPTIQSAISIFHVTFFGGHVSGFGQFCWTVVEHSSVELCVLSASSNLISLIFSLHHSVQLKVACKDHTHLQSIWNDTCDYTWLNTVNYAFIESICIPLGTGSGMVIPVSSLCCWKTEGWCCLFLLFLPSLLFKALLALKPPTPSSERDTDDTLKEFKAEIHSEQECDNWERREGRVLPVKGLRHSYAIFFFCLFACQDRQRDGDILWGGGGVRVSPLMDLITVGTFNDHCCTFNEIQHQTCIYFVHAKGKGGFLRGVLMHYYK